MSRPDYSKFRCVQCGRCCLQYGGYIYATEEDLQRWEKEGRQDILQYIMPYIRNGKRDGADLWFDPQTRRELIFCPFLKRKEPDLNEKLARSDSNPSQGVKYICLIQKTKPRYCLEYVCRKHPK